MLDRELPVVIPRAAIRGTRLADLALVAAVVALLCLVGIWSRPSGLASLWPANPVLLGILIRKPALVTSPSVWAVAAMSYVSIDLVTGSSLSKALWLNAANLVGVGAGVLAVSRIRPVDKRLGRTISINMIFLCCVAASAGSALIGSWAYMAVFDGTLKEGSEIWFTAELANYMAFLPVMLAAPQVGPHIRAGQIMEMVRPARQAVLPMALLLACLVVIVVLPDSALLALPIPILLWCAMRAGVFATTILTLITISWLMFMIGEGMIGPMAIGTSSAGFLTFQVTLALVSMGPISVACGVDVRDRALRDLHDKAHQDELTKVLNRRGFMDTSSDRLDELSVYERQVALLMIDLDHFKEINDRHGHAAGDAVLVSFGSSVQALLRDTDTFGRVGGEEFAVLLPGISSTMAETVAERVRVLATEVAVPVPDGEVNYTVSIGLVHSSDSSQDLDTLICEADEALYRAKGEGRNRVASVLK